MTQQPLTLDSLFDALAEGWRGGQRDARHQHRLHRDLRARRRRHHRGLLARGWTPFVIAAAGAFMLVGPVILAGYFGIAGLAAGRSGSFSAVAAGFGGASQALWALAWSAACCS